MANNNRFWMVYNLSGYGNPHERFSSRDAARTYAERHAAEHPGAEFFIVCATARVQATSVIYTALETC